MAKPVFATSDVPSASEVNNWFVNVTFARKTANQSVTSSTTLTDDTQLAVAVDSNTVYELTAMIVYDGATGGDMKIGWSGPSGVGMSFVANGLGTNAALYTDDQVFVGDILSTPIFGALNAGTNVGLLVQGLVLTTGTAGTFTFRWAQGTSNATATRVLSNSYLMLRRVA